jgi:hypothetical protein
VQAKIGKARFPDNPMPEIENRHCSKIQTRTYSPEAATQLPPFPQPSSSMVTIVIRTFHMQGVFLEFQYIGLLDYVIARSSRAS